MRPQRRGSRRGTLKCSLYSEFSHRGAPPHAKAAHILYVVELLRTKLFAGATIFDWYVVDWRHALRFTASIVSTVCIQALRPVDEQDARVHAAPVANAIVTTHAAKQLARFGEIVNVVDVILSSSFCEFLTEKWFSPSDSTMQSRVMLGVTILWCQIAVMDTC